MKRAPWAIVLAGGDGARLAGMTTDEEGRPAPKQYCRFGGDRSLLARALDRAERLTSSNRIIAVVSRDHVRWWLPALQKYPAENCLAQPENRGTAAAILAALGHIMRLDEDPRIAILPSDQAVADEAALSSAFARALECVARSPEVAVLLGIPPDGPEEGYGWIEPLPADATEPRPVGAFVEKPLPGVAAELLRRGALWNSFLIAANGRCLRDLFRITQPELLRAFDRAQAEPWRLPAAYASLPVRDFCRHVLEGVPGRLRVLRVPPCGWIDLGSPARVRRFLAADRAARGTPDSGCRPAASAAGVFGATECDGDDAQISFATG